MYTAGLWPIPGMLLMAYLIRSGWSTGRLLNCFLAVRIRYIPSPSSIPAAGGKGKVMSGTGTCIHT